MNRKPQDLDGHKNEAPGFNKLRTVILASLLGIIVLHLSSFLPGLYRSVKRLQRAQRLSFLNDVSDKLFTAVGNYGFERGRVNVVLNDAGPVAQMEANRQFILERQAQGDDALAEALEKLSEVTLPDMPEKIFHVKRLKTQIQDLRLQTGRDMILGKEDRDPELAQAWFAAMTKTIEGIEALLVTISIDISDSDGVISRYFSLKHQTLALRNTAGPEMSILAATMLSGAPIKQGLQDKIQDLNTITSQHFKNIEFLCQGFSTPIIPDALKELKQRYFSDYLPRRNEIYPLAKTGGPYPYSQQAFLDHGVEALKGIARFMDILVTETKAYAAEQLNRDRRQIALLCISSVGSLLALILIMFYTNIRVITPIGRLTSVLQRLGAKELDVAVPLLDQRNEIGRMARALAVFQHTSIRLKEENQLLQIAEEKVRISQEKLKTILNNIPDMIVECDDNLIVLWANTAALAAESGIIGQPYDTAFGEGNGLYDECYCQKALETGEIQAGIITASKTAGKRYWELIAIPVKNSRSPQAVLAVSRDVTARMNAEKDKEVLISELSQALSKVKTLSGLLPICSHCKKIRDDQGYWNSIESYIHEHSEAVLSHGICNDCIKKYYPEFSPQKEMLTT